MKVTINVIKYETINGKKVGKAFSFPVDAKKMAKYKTEATVRKKVEEYIVKNGVFQKDEMKDLTYDMKDFLTEWKKQKLQVEAEHLEKLETFWNVSDWYHRPYEKASSVPLDIRILCGAIAGDIIGSVYEFEAQKETDFPLFRNSSTFTDDTIMTVANADWLLGGDDLLGIMKTYGNHYPNAGWGGMFMRWLRESDPQPYHSFGNGSAMRVSPVGWAFDSLEETLDVAKRSAEITHNHPEGIKGAQATAACIFLARTGKSKQEIKEYIERTFGYNLSRTCNEIRLTYQFDESCQRTVPESIIAFLDSTDFESAIRLAISLGGDADTLGAITGSIAEAYYGEMPENIRKEVLKRLPNKFIRVMQNFYQKYVEK
jgi:ADP-ribosylglycohydrolase